MAEVYRRVEDGIEISYEIIDGKGGKRLRIWAEKDGKRCAARCTATLAASVILFDRTNLQGPRGSASSWQRYETEPWGIDLPVSEASR